MGRHARRALSLALIAALAFPPAAARSQAFCPDGAEDIPAGAALLVLQPLLIDSIGDATECEHSADNGDLLQSTTGGLAFWQVSTQSAHFTNGSENWSYADGALNYAVDDGSPPAQPVPVAEAPMPQAPPAPGSV